MTKYLITSALPYINGIKHLGNLVGSMLPADVYARYLRQAQHEVLFICGTDDHGAPAEIAAIEHDTEVGIFCRNMHDTQKTIYEQFHLSFDYFGKTSDAANHLLTQDIFNKLDANGYIRERTIEQYYAIKGQRFLADRHITGTCPLCAYDKARGDQCDGCGALLNPTELLSPHSSLDKNDTLELRKTQHLFLDLVALQPLVSDWTATLKQPSKVVAGIIKKWLEEGLTERCITRDLSWGVKVPKTGYEAKVFYVWFDAPMGYISMTQDYFRIHDGAVDAWRDWWLSADVHYTQFMAKDNVPFHAIMWPAMLLGTHDNWHMVDNIKGLNWLTYAGGKFSTSQKRGIFTDEALRLFPADYWRYYLLANIPESSDADFSFQDFANIINHDLADKLGNFTSRVLALVEKYCDSKVAVYTQDDINQDLVSQVMQLCKTLDTAFAELKYREIITHLRNLWILANEYITAQAPWTLMKTDTKAAKLVLVHCLHFIRIFAITLAPIMPETAEILLKLLGHGLTLNVPIIDAADFSCLKVGEEVSKKIALFKKIEPDEIAVLEQRFAGQE
jgi:methionyl-tRNA synthetase